jgi:crossover junction endodeoxyribonuclease RuvC
MFVLGIDPGLSRCGYGLVAASGDTTRPDGLRAVAAGVLETDPAAPLPDRLHLLRDELRRLMAEHRPQVVAVERVFFQVNARTAMSVGQASGLALAEAAAFGCEVAQYTANEVKQALAGWGAADKEQVRRMVAAVLGVASVPGPPDVADALALALCHLFGAPVRRAVRVATAAEAGS